MWSLPVGIRSAIDAEARRRGMRPSQIAEAVFARYLPTFIADSLAEALRDEPSA
jgi:hypothetical protein